MKDSDRILKYNVLLDKIKTNHCFSIFLKKATQLYKQ